MRRGLGVAVLALSLAACGSTVPSSSTAVGNGLDGPATTGGTQSPTPAEDLPSTTGDATTGSATGGSTGGSSSTTTASTGSGTGGEATASTDSAPTTSASHAASAKTPIRVGVLYTPGTDAAAAAIGIKGLTTGDTKAEAAAVVAWINAHGAVGGHPIQLFPYAIDSGASSADAAAQAACTKMTQDFHVRYVVTIIAVVPSFVPCLAKSGVGLLDDESNLGDAAMAKYAHFLGNPGEIAPGRLASVLVDNLWQRGWLTPKSKVGVLAVDNTDGHATVSGALTAALRKHGLTAANTQFVNPNGGDGGSGQSSSAALQFRSASVDRVISVLYSPLYFMLAASSQAYHPEYALSSNLGPGALLEGTAPTDQLKNAAGIGWQPYLDIGKGTHPGPVSSRETLCFQLMQKAGQATTAATAKGFQLQVCDVLLYLKALGDLEPTVPKDLVTSGRALLGSRFVSADTFRSDVTRRTDGVAGIRSLTFEGSCSCFQYTSPVQATP